MTDFDKRLYSVYERGRALSSEAECIWRDIISCYIPKGSERMDVLDLGSGTGRFSRLLAEHFARRVYAVEPSRKMLDEARRLSTDRRIAYVCGRAESIPLIGGRCKVAFLSQILHHLKDLDACVAEVSRILQPDGVVIIRNTFRGRLSGIKMFEFFPGALEIDSRRLPSLESVTNAFAARSFEVTDLQVIHYPTDACLQDHLERTRLRSTSVLEELPDDEFEAGLRRMEQVASAESPTVVTGRVDVLALRRTP